MGIISRVVAVRWHTRRKRGAVDALVLGLVLSYSAAGDQGQVITEVSDFGSNPGNLQMFQYTPENIRLAPPLVVALHGCAQTAMSYAQHSGWIKYADTYGVVLLFPQQKRRNNLNRCFNWFRLDDTRRDRGEALSIRQMIDHVRVGLEVAADRIFVTGLSAGGAMTSVMLATYPEIFRGGAVLAGIPYGCASGLWPALGCVFRGDDQDSERWAKRVRDASGYAGEWPKVAIWQGREDPFVDPTNAGELVEQWTEIHGIDREADTEEVTERYVHKVYRDARGVGQVELYLIPDMGHGLPVDPGLAQHQCGEEGLFFPDVDVCSSYYIAEFWGLNL